MKTYTARLLARARASLIGRALQKTLDDRGPDMAATIAFWALFSIFPLLLGTVALASFAFDDPATQETIYEFVAESFPGSSALVQSNVEAVARSRGAMGAVGVLALLWSASAAFGAVTRCLNSVWDNEPATSAILEKLRSLGLALLLAVLLVTSVVATTVVEVLIGLAPLERLGVAVPNWTRLVAWGTSIAFVLLLFALLYRLVPTNRPAWRHVFPGAVLATSLFELGKAGFLVYLERGADYEAVYGSLSSIIVLLLWLFLSSLVLILGAELSAVRATTYSAD